MKRLLTLTMLLGVLFPGVYSEETGWSYKQTTLQSFYMFFVGDSPDLTIDGVVPDESDVIGAFTSDGVCVGWTYAVANNGFITVPTVGNDGSDYAINYLANGDVPIFRIFDASSGDSSTPETQNGVMPLDLSGASFTDGSDGGFSNNAIYISSGPALAESISGCSDSGSCSFDDSLWLTVGEYNGDTAFVPSGGTLTSDDGSCLYADCAGECGGSAEVDECGECGGDGIDEGACDCDGNVLDCAGECGGSAEEDCAGVCNGSSELDACGVCDGDESSCTGCTNEDADNYDAGNTIDDSSCEFSVDTPSDLTAEGGPARVILSWGDVGADLYEIYLNDGTQVGSTSSSSAQVLGLSPGIEYCLYVVAVQSFDYGDGVTVSSDASESACAIPTESVGITWGWQMTADIDGWGIFPASSEHNYLGFSASATNGFDASLDIPEPPIGASQNYIQAYFGHPEWSNIYGDNFTQDVRSESPEDLPACDGQDVTNLECNLVEFEVLVVSDMAGEASITFEEYSTSHAASGADVPIPANVHTYAEIDGVHHLVSEGASLEFFLSEGIPKLITVTIGNIVPQAPASLSADGGHLQIDLDWDSDSNDIQDIAGRYPATSFNVYRDGGPLSEDQSLSALISEDQDNTDYNDQEDMEGHTGYGLLWESSYDYTVTGNNEAGESTDGHRVSHHDGTHSDLAGRQSDASATTDDNTNPVSVTAHVETLNGTNISSGHYEITHNGSADANTVNIHADGSGSNDSDVNLDGAIETDQFGNSDGRYLWTQTAGEAVELSGAETADVSFDIANVHDGDTKSITLNLHVETDYPVKGGISTRSNDQEITVIIDDEPNHDPVAPEALALRVGGNGLSVLTYDDFLSEDVNDTNDYDAQDQIWYVPHDANPDTDVADLHFDGTSTDADAGDLDGTNGQEVADEIYYQWSLITGAAAGFTFEDLNANGEYDFGEPIFGGGGEEIYYETNYGDVIADGPSPADLGTDELQSLSLPADVYILNLHIEDPYGDSDFVSYVIGVSAERNDAPTSDAGLDQEWYMNYEEDYKDVEMSAHNVDDSDHDPLVYSYSYEGPGTNAGAQAQNESNYEGFDGFWDASGLYDLLENGQGLVEGDHIFTLTTTDPYGATASDSFVISVYDEPAAVAAVDLRVTNPDQAFKHIEIAWEEGIHADDAFLVDGTYLWTGEHANADYFIVYLNGEQRALYMNDEDVEGETYTHLEPALEAETDYTFVVESYNSDDRLGDDSSDDVDQTTHDRPTITVLNPNGAEIASVGDLYNVDISTTNKQFISNIDVLFLDEESGEYIEEEQNPELGTTGESTQIDSEGEEIYYGAKVKVIVTDVGNYHDLQNDPDHEDGVIGSYEVSGDGHKESKEDSSDDSFTLAAHTLTKSFWGGWHLFGPALTPYESAMEVNLSECFGNFGANWIAYDQAGNYDIATLDLNLGQGYYLALAATNDMFLHGDPVVGDPDNGSQATLSLEKGWNLASNPLVNIIDRNQLTVEYTDDEGNSETLPWQQAANAGWVQTNINTWYIDSHMHANELVPFGGYWFHTSRDLEVHVTSHLNDYSSREAVQDGWSLTLNASDALGIAGGDFVSISIKEDANEAFVYGEDEIDHPNPMKSDFIDMHIDRFDWVGTKDNNGFTVESPYFASDVRSFSETEDFLAWNVSAEAYNVQGEVTLSWGMTDDIESDVNLIVEDEVYNLKELASIDVSTNSLDDMVIVVGNLSSYYGAPDEFALSSAYPNPFNPSTSLDLSLNNSGHVSVKVYNVLGQLTATLVNGNMDAGYHTLTWDASNMASGMYFVRVETGADVAVQKLMLMK